MAKLATKMFGAEVAAAQPAPQAGANDDKAAALAAKVELQNTMPPDTHRLGTSNTEVGMTEAQLMQRMNDPNLTYEESAKLIASVSPALRQKLGI
jgi:hypothetical protein